MPQKDWARMVPKSADSFSAWLVMQKDSAMAKAAGAALQGGRGACLLQDCRKTFNLAAPLKSISTHFLFMPSSEQLEFRLL